MTNLTNETNPESSMVVQNLSKQENNFFDND